MFELTGIGSDDGRQCFGPAPSGFAYHPVYSEITQFYLLDFGTQKIQIFIRVIETPSDETCMSTGRSKGNENANSCKFH
jgi:hypothetical protein